METRNLVFLHGLGQTASSWNGVTKKLGDEFSVHCPELSLWVQKQPRYEHLYQELEVYMESIEPPIILCGLSLGGVLALQYAIEHGERLQGLVLIAAQVTMPAHIIRLQNFMFRLLPSRVFYNMGLGKREMISLCSSMTELDFQKALQTIPCVTLVVCGEKDKMNRKAAVELSQRIPNVRYVTVPGAGHEVNVDQPAELGRILHNFLR